MVILMWFMKPNNLQKYTGIKISSLVVLSRKINININIINFPCSFIKQPTDLSYPPPTLSWSWPSTSKPSALTNYAKIHNNFTFRSILSKMLLHLDFQTKIRIPAFLHRHRFYKCLWTHRKPDLSKAFYNT